MLGTAIQKRADQKEDQIRKPFGRVRLEGRIWLLVKRRLGRFRGVTARNPETIICTVTDMDTFSATAYLTRIKLIFLRNLNCLAAFIFKPSSL
jgi:hypothetical protein